MPDPGRDVGDDVGVELVLLDFVLKVVLVPRAIRALAVDQPLVGGFGFGPVLADGERHGGLDVVPRVGVPAGEPGDHARRQLPVGDVGSGDADLVGGDQAGEVRRGHRRPLGSATASRYGAVTLWPGRRGSCPATG